MNGWKYKKQWNNIIMYNCVRTLDSWTLLAEATKHSKLADCNEETIKILIFVVDNWQTGSEELQLDML
jgi:IMP cyclohydrolase